MIAVESSRHPWRDCSRVVSLIVCCCLIRSALLAAPARAGQLGFYIGPNVANLGGDAESLGDDMATAMEIELGGQWSVQKESLTGVLVGGYILLDLTPTFALQVGAQYVQRGVNYDLTVSGLTATPVSVHTRFRFRYVEFPLLARLTSNPGGKVRPLFTFGPVLGLRSAADLELEVMGTEQSEDITDEIKSAYLGALVGGGLAVAAGPNATLVLQASYLYGLTQPMDLQGPDGRDVVVRIGDFAVLGALEFAIGGSRVR